MSDETRIRELEAQLDEILAGNERLRKIEKDRNYALQCQNEQLEAVVDERNELRKMKGVDAWADAVRAKARLACLLPREDEIDSIMSLLNWTREHHDVDSTARQWLERVVQTALAARIAPNQDGEK